MDEMMRERLWIVYAQLKRFKLQNDQDAESFAYEALYRAILTFDSSNDASLDTYATCVIANRLRQHLRTLQKKRQIHTTSLFESVDEDGQVYLIDTVRTCDTTEDIVCATIMSNRATDIIASILEDASQNYRDVIQMWYESDFKATQKEIADTAGISQAAVSRIISNFKYKLKTELEDYL